MKSEDQKEIEAMEKFPPSQKQKNQIIAEVQRIQDFYMKKAMKDMYREYSETD